LALRWGTIDFDAQERATGLAAPPGYSLRSICLKRLEALMPLADAPSSVLGEDDRLRTLIVLQHLFAYAIVGDRERVERFGRLAAVISSAIPIGWKKDYPAVLLVRVA
ncbi:MAG: hypothetical protein Q8R16_05345, partial [bacterium]|nr:hypothetical protein [bacterium]